MSWQVNAKVGPFRYTRPVRNLGGILLAAVLLFCGCTVWGAVSKVTDDQPADAPVVEYTTVDDLRSDVEAAGVECAEAKPVHEPINGGRDMLSCTNLSLSTYDSHEPAAAYPAFLYGMVGGELDVWVVVGTNWTANCSGNPYTCQQIVDHMGGEIVRYSA